ncbi:xanthine dehydrogenase isoform X2 [Exaiptasia diaphana]|nr:xanthine dehydrogenase isoform X2 [Exaiptasia diaphana]
MVMNMYGLLKTNPTPSRQDIEDHFDGNICRCTGYRPILDAMKTFAKDSSPIEIEEIVSSKCGRQCNGSGCAKICHKEVKETDSLWFNPVALQDMYTLLAKYSDKRTRIVGGNTGKGIYDDGSFDVFIDVNQIPEIKTVELALDGLSVGGAVTLSSLIDALDGNEPTHKLYSVLAKHVRKVANVQVRNVATVAGNLMLTHDHPDFPSDIFTILETVGSTVRVVDAKTGKPYEYSLMNFLDLDMTAKVILSVLIPKHPESVNVHTFKVMPRAQNAHAYVNAGFAVNFDSSIMTGSSYRIVYGGIGPYAMHASKTEMYLKGKQLTEINTLQGALEILDQELVPDTPKVSATVAYRKSLGLGLFYKFYLAMLGNKASSRVQSAAKPFLRAVSSGKQDFDTHPNLYPLTQPMTKLAAKLQSAGEAVYTNDLPTQGGELHAAFVLSTQGNCRIDTIDASAALNMPGVVDFLTAGSIPSKGVNSFNDGEKEEVFCSGEVLYAGQAVGLIIADSQCNADAAALAVKVTYKNVQSPILTIQQAIAAKSFYPNIADPLVVGDAKGAIKASSHVIKGEISMGTQHHFYMENQVCLCIPEEDGLTIHCASQWMDLLQRRVALVLGISENRLNVQVKRCGGAYGGKASRTVQIAAAAALAAVKLRRPVRLSLNFHTNMRMIGKRAPFLATYQVGVGNDGLLNGIDMTYYADYGSSSNDSDVSAAFFWCDNAYHCGNWKITPIACKTNLASNTWVRSPSSIQAIFIMETILEHVAKALNKTPEEVRQVNLYKKGQKTPYGYSLDYCNIGNLWTDLQESCDYSKRREAIDTFNKANRWRKRGISLVPLRWSIQYGGEMFTSMVSIYHGDGTIAVNHAGIEVGQGINTKVAQVAAHVLEVPIDNIVIKATTNLISPNSDATAGSVGSELVCESVVLCCETLKKRIDPIRQKYKPSSWQALITKCQDEGVDLSAKIMYQGSTKPYVYSTYGATCTEVELDVLTGERDIIRTDILYDCGQSMNPEIDVGQVEGAFVMGLGYWMTEKAIYDNETGEELTYSTWEYKPPCSKDIPIDFRVRLLKNAPNPKGILSSKAVGEPPMCMSCSSLFAVKHAVQSARGEINQDEEYFPLDGPSTVEASHMACLVNPKQFTL